MSNLQYENYIKYLFRCYNQTLFIAAIALLAPFMPTATDDWACIACMMEQNLLRAQLTNATYKVESEYDDFWVHLRMSCYSSHLSSTSL